MWVRRRAWQLEPQKFLPPSQERQPHTTLPPCRTWLSMPSWDSVNWAMAISMRVRIVTSLCVTMSNRLQDDGKGKP